MRSYKEIIHIDEGNLWKEWVDAPARYMEVIEAKVEASAQVDKLKDKLTVLEAECAHDIRQDPSTYRVEKVTVDSVKDAVAAQPNVKKLKEELLEARKQQELISGLVTAMDHRRRALENLVELHIRNYLAEPRPISETSVEQVEKATAKRTHDAVAERMSRKRVK